MTQRRTVFFVSDGTGITAQMLGHSLLTQFEGVEFNQVTLPFIDSAEKAEECLARIEAEGANGTQPIVFSTLVNQDVRAVVLRAKALFLDFFETFIDPLAELAGAQELAEGVGRGGEAARHTNAGGGESARHFPERGVLAAHLREVGESQIL